MNLRIDRSKAVLTKKGFQFAPLRPQSDAGQPLQGAGLSGANEVLIFERNGHRRALLLRQMAYHHVCQGELAGEPYLVSF